MKAGFVALLLGIAMAAQAQDKALTVLEASKTCVVVIERLASSVDLAIEATEHSNAQELTITWPLEVDKNPTYCVVDRQTKKIAAVTRGTVTISGAELSRMVDRTKTLKQVASGDTGDFVSKAKATVTNRFKDPDSAKFRNLFISDKGVTTLCGEVNAKNSYGAYVGFRRFYSNGSTELTDVENPRDNFVFSGMWPSMCGTRKTEVEN